jgi:hypothetical protein
MTTVTSAILQMPTFCWQTMFEVVTFAEQIHDGVEYPSVSATLLDLVRRGYLEVKQAPKTKGRGGPMIVNMYRRKEASPPFRPRTKLRPSYSRAS